MFSSTTQLLAACMVSPTTQLSVGARAWYCLRTMNLEAGPLLVLLETLFLSRGRSVMFIMQRKVSRVGRIMFIMLTIRRTQALFCGLVEGGGYYSAETLSDSQKLTADTLKKEAGDKWKDIVEYDGLQLLEMNPSERARSSQTDVVTGAPDSCPSGIDLASSPYVDPPVNPGLHIGAPVPCQPPSVPSGEAYENSMLDFGESIFAPMLVDDSMDLTSLFQQDLSEKADGNTSVDAFCREDDPSHLPESSRDPPEQAGGNTVLSVGDGGSFERGGGSNSPWIEEGIYYHQAGGSQHRSQSKRSSSGTTNVGNVKSEVSGTIHCERSGARRRLLGWNVRRRSGARRRLLGSNVRRRSSDRSGSGARRRLSASNVRRRSSDRSRSGASIELAIV